SFLTSRYTTGIYAENGPTCVYGSGHRAIPVSHGQHHNVKEPPPPYRTAPNLPPPPQTCNRRGRPTPVPSSNLRRARRRRTAPPRTFPQHSLGSRIDADLLLLRPRDLPPSLHLARQGRRGRRRRPGHLRRRGRHRHLRRRTQHGPRHPPLGPHHGRPRRGGPRHRHGDRPRPPRLRPGRGRPLLRGPRHALAPPLAALPQRRARLALALPLRPLARRRPRPPQPPDRPRSLAPPLRRHAPLEGHPQARPPLPHQ